MATKIIDKRLQKTKKHFEALAEYKQFIDNSGFDYSVENFEKLDTAQKGVLEAYLKRFASLQDYLGAKVFRNLLDLAGISYTKMSEVLTLVENEEIVELDKWIEFRNARNNLEHDYPDELEETLRDLHYCIDSFGYMKDTVEKVFEFARRYGANI